MTVDAVATHATVATGWQHGHVLSSPLTWLTPLLKTRVFLSDAELHPLFKGTYIQTNTKSIVFL